MSTDPSTPSPHDGAAPRPAAGYPARASGTTSPTAPAPLRAGSGILARVLTVLYALVVTPLAVGLVMYGGQPWQQFMLTRGADGPGLIDFLSSPNGASTLIALVGGLLLLVSVVATGLASAAGLLSVSVLCVFPLSLSVVPQLMTWLYENMPAVLRAIGPGLYGQGLPLVLYPVMGGLGLALVIARRRPRSHPAISLPGLVLVPVMMLIGAWLIMYGYAVVLRTFNITFGTEAVPAPAMLALVVGMVVLWLSVGAAGASPYALVLPALVLLALSAGFLMPGFFSMLPGVMFSPTGSTALAVLALGAGPAVGIVLLAHTAVQFAVSSRARRRLQAASAL